MELNQPHTIRAWCFFDWANSAYSLVITTAVFPLYYSAVTESAFGGRLVQFFGLEVDKGALYSYAISFSFLLIAFLSPILSGIADYGGSKKQFMRFFTLLGSIACLSLFFFTGRNIELGIIAAILASIGYAGALVFYNAFLPEIATADQFDRISAKGFSFGYLGSVLILVLILTMIQQPAWFGLPNASIATRISFLMVGMWWIGFSQITFKGLPERRGHRFHSDLLARGFKELKKVWKSLQHHRYTRIFLVAFFLYNTGVQTTIYLASLFGSDELNLETGQLITTILLLQVVAIIGATLFARISEARGNRFTLSVILIIWMSICTAAYFVHSATEFYMLAGGVGMVMGGVQSLSRATYSKLIPEHTHDTASFFSFYDVLDKCSTVLGTMVYGIIIQLSGGSMRNSALALSLFFIAGLMVLQQVKIPKTHLPATA
ncbi:MAG: MFS transporter [Cytophagales bacterium]|nr:MFS transporter [Bernardetiaceae bacterium]MDW8203420.1 MFS transporter [Cytophagales bacterium]